MENAKKSKSNKTDHVPANIEVPTPPDGGYAWIVLIAAFVIINKYF